MTDYQRARLDRFAYAKAMRAVKGAMDGSACIGYNNILHKYRKLYAERTLDNF